MSRSQGTAMILHRVSMLLVPMLALAVPASATTVIRETLAEMVHDSSVIVVGTVTGASSRWGDASHRWMVTDYTIQTEDAVLDDGSVKTGGTLVVTFWGGTIGGETQGIFELTTPVPGQRYVLMLREGWQSGGFSPIVGFNQGLLAVRIDPADGVEYVADGVGVPLRATGGGVVRGIDAGPAGDAAPRVSLVELVGWLRNNLTALKAQAPRVRQVPDAGDPRVLPVYEASPEVGGRVPAAPAALANTAAPSAAEPTAPGRPSGAEIRGRVEGTPVVTVKDPASLAPKPLYAAQGYANLPITINPFPTSWVWSPHDQNQLWKWNYYGGDFWVSLPPTGTFGWPNGRWDLDGWPSSGTLNLIYGSGHEWLPGVLGVTLYRYDFWNRLLLDEADVALNPAYSWTLDDEWVFNGAPAQSFRKVMIHELGHLWGAAHSCNAQSGNCTFLSLMQDGNVANDPFGAFTMPFKDDAELIRALYPGNAQPRTDLGVSLFRAMGGPSRQEAFFPSRVVAGDNMTIWNFQVENVGTTTINTPTLEWYLTTARNYDSPYTYLGTTSFAQPLPRGGSYDPFTVNVSVPVPTWLDGGDYYLGAYVRNDGGAGQAAFPFSNNFGWSKSKVTVLPRVISVNVTPFGGGTQAYGTVFLGSRAGPDGFNVLLTSSDPAVTLVPVLLYIEPQWSIGWFAIQSVPVTTPTQVTITASGSNAPVETTVTILVAAQGNASAIAGAIGQKVTLKATFTRLADQAPLANKAVRFHVDGDAVSQTVLTNTAGVATLPYFIPEGAGPGLRAYNADLLGDASTAPSFSTGTLTVSPALTKVVPLKVSGSVGQLVQFTARLSTTLGNSPVSGRTLVFSFAPTGNDGVALTDANGRAAVKMRIPTTGVGTFAYYARSSDDSAYFGSAGSAALTVSKAGVTLTTKSVTGARGATVTLSAVLKRTTDKVALGGRPIVFSVNGVTYQATTDASGKAAATHVIPAATAPGTYPITATFAGDALHLPRNAAGVLTVK